MANEQAEVSEWGLDPLFWSCARLANVEVLSLLEHPTQPGCYLLHDRPVLRAHVQGDIVSVRERQKNVTFGVDDGSAVLACVLWLNEDDADVKLDSLQLGQLVSVRGKITVFRDERQLTVTSWHVETDAHAQCMHWLTVMKLHREEYSICHQHVDFKPPVNHRNAPKKTSTFCDKLHAFLLSDAKFKRFEFNSLLEEPNLVSQAVDVLEIAQPLSEEEQHRLRRFVASSMRQLTCKGVVAVTDIVSDTYELISVETHICPAIVGIVRNTCRHGYDNVSTRHIIDAMRSHSLLSHVPTDRLKEAIVLAVSRNDLYEVDTDTYRPL